MCGIFGMTAHKNAGRLAYLGLYALQHRGEESSGIVTFESRKNKLSYHRGMGLVSDVFDEAALCALKGDTAVGHVRYSTTGSSVAKNIQPFFVNHRREHIVIAHNGNLINSFALRDEIEAKGSIFQTTMDSEVLAHLITSSNSSSIKSRIVGALGRLEGAYSLVLMVGNMLIGARDPRGFRPLCLGRLDGAYILASETCALDLIGASYLRDIEPGEIVFISNNRIESVKPFLKCKHCFCIFEYIYFARPDSNIFGHNVYLARKRLGAELARESGAKCDFVMPIPDSGSYAAVGFARECKMPFEMAIIRNHYVGRTFIQPDQLIRDFRVKIKLNPIKDALKGKRVIVVEDSIVRGTTSRARITALRKAGLSKIHMRVSCPPLKHPCFYGIDFPTENELIASNKTIKDIKEYIGLDSLKYLSLSGMLKSMPLPDSDFCTACFTGKYPTAVPEGISKDILEKGSPKIKGRAR